ncbi:hypothetical protein [Candidatus Mycoplasma haematobovis]|nr:hypothetical protein [Candidatus Mycoplasma haematobovis]
MILRLALSWKNKKIAKAVLMICYEKKIKKLKKEEIFNILEKELKE